ncbi:hypothetical protein BT69DRAFT_1402154, partial [Atractiella rhizophila]
MAPQERKKSQRQQTLKDMSNEKRRKKDLEAEEVILPLPEAFLGTNNIQGFAEYLDMSLSKLWCLLAQRHLSMPVEFIQEDPCPSQLNSQAEDNDDPFHAAFSGWRPSSLNDVGYQDGLKMFATLWKRLQHVTYVPEVTLCARKAYLCAAAEHIHAILLPEGLVDLPGPDQLFLPDQDEDGEGEDLRMEPAPEEIKAAEVAQILPLKIDSSKKKNKRRK